MGKSGSGSTTSGTAWAARAAQRGVPATGACAAVQVARSRPAGRWRQLIDSGHTADGRNGGPLTPPPGEGLELHDARRREALTYAVRPGNGPVTLDLAVGPELVLTVLNATDGTAGREGRGPTGMRLRARLAGARARGTRPSRLPTRRVNSTRGVNEVIRTVRIGP